MHSSPTCLWHCVCRHFTESEPPDESEGPQGLLQRAKASMRGSPVKLVDLALPSLGALGSVALSNEHDWSGETTACCICRLHTTRPALWCLHASRSISWWTQNLQVASDKSTRIAYLCHR